MNTLHTFFQSKFFLGIVVIAVLLAVGYGAFLVGTPQAQRAFQLDQRRVSDLQQISSAIDAYFEKNKSLPQSFDDLKKQSYYVQSVTDPKAGSPYEYRIVSATTYELCAVFDTESSQARSKVNTQIPFSQQAWDHGRGRTCFERETRATAPATSTPSSKDGLEVTSPCAGLSRPVCGQDGKNYASQCLADFLGVKVAHEGLCQTQ